MKHTQHVDVAAIFDQIRNPVVLLEQDSDVSLRSPVTVADLRVGVENLSFVVDALNCLYCRLRVVSGNEPEDVLEPTLRFKRPAYLRHVRMRCAISSFDTTRFASESAKPRSTIK
ncbi:MAG TPA: hypothetical protein VFU13_05555 [Steroidobacteraceae bacterium]|nr:hypothetical protein [Steroidobacteraceae bacterium]